MTPFEQQLQTVVRDQNVKMAAMEQQLKVLTQQTLSIDSLAGKRIPYSVNIAIEIPQGEDSLLTQSRNISRAGPFFCERLYATLRIATVQAGGDASWVGMYLPITSLFNYPFIWPVGITGTISDPPPLDFEFGYESDASDRVRQDSYLPGAILEPLLAGAGIRAVSDVFAAGATITFKLMPLRAVGNHLPWSAATGVATFMFNAVFEGYKIIQPMQV